MSTTTTNRRRRAGAVAVLAAALLGSGFLASSALFTDQESADTGTFSMGTLDLSKTANASLFLPTSNLAPGDSRVDSVNLRNAGSLDLRYSINSVVEQAALNNLTLEVKSGTGTCDDAGFAAYGTTIYGPGNVGAVAPGVDIVGSSVAGAQAGDRPLAVGVDETLCFKVVAPIGLDNTYKGANLGKATLTFNAEQTANNA